MPKRSHAAATEATDKGSHSRDVADSERPFVQRKTERSHEENQERAYIAASRRSDRSLDARVQSARMASEIHKKRTGKGFRISPEIVQKEEMYEEEDDDVPRSYRLLGPHMQTASAEMNSKLEAYMSSRLAMSAYMSRMDDSWRENNINQMFAAAFPNLGMQAQQLGGEMFPSEGGRQHHQQQQQQQPPQQQPPRQQPQSPQSAAGSAVSPRTNQASMHLHTTGRNHSFSTLSPTTTESQMATTPDLTVASSPESRIALKEHLNMSHLAPPKSPMPDISGPGTDSAFTAELPQEMKLLMGGPPGMEMAGFGQSMYDQSFMPVDQALYDPDLTGASKLGSLETGSGDMYAEEDWDFMTQTQTQAQAPDQPMDEAWDAFINESAWDTNHGNNTQQ